jgi:hypothetical protein
MVVMSRCLLSLTQTKQSLNSQLFPTSRDGSIHKLLATFRPADVHGHLVSTHTSIDSIYLASEGYGIVEDIHRPCQLMDADRRARA